MIKLNDLRTELIEVPTDELRSVVGGQTRISSPAPIRSAMPFNPPPKVIMTPAPAPAPAPTPSVTGGFQVTPGVGTQLNGSYTNGYSTFGANTTIAPNGSVGTYGGSITTPIGR
jgi:hypothetical protein